MNIKYAYLISFVFCFMSVLGVTLNNMKLNQDIKLDKIDIVDETIQKTNSTLIIQDGITQGNIYDSENLKDTNGITFDAQDGFVKFFFNDGTPMQSMDRILINNKSLGQILYGQNQEMIDLIVEQKVDEKIKTMNPNPLWGKKLGIMGDSETTVPSLNESFGALIAARNNMTLYHHGVGGKRLVSNRDSNIAVINNYTNMPKDVDYILVQIGYNDSEHWNYDETNGTLDTELNDTNSFKSCWNNFLIGVKTNYPSAKIGIILPFYHSNNVGQDSYAYSTTSTQYKRSRWQRTQCEKLNIPVFDPVTDVKGFIYYTKSYPAQNYPENVSDWYDQTKLKMNTAYPYDNARYTNITFSSQYMVDGVHTSARGSLFLSYEYERWMKTVLQCN